MPATVRTTDNHSDWYKSPTEGAVQELAQSVQVLDVHALNVDVAQASLSAVAEGIQPLNCIQWPIERPKIILNRPKT